MDAVPRLRVASANGQLYVRQSLQIQPNSNDQRFHYGIISMSLEGQKAVSVGSPGFIAPFLAIMPFLLVLAVCPYVRRFSLRTLLIATTPAAVILDLFVWSFR